MEHLPWWLGAMALAGTSLGYTLVVRRPLGVSGAVGTVLDPDQRTQEQEIESTDMDALEAALRAATEAEFGGAVAGAAGEAESPATATVPAVGRLGWSRSFVFLVGVTLGGLVFSLLTGAHRELLPSGAYAHFFGQGASAVGALFIGGILVGAGTSLGSGCTSGHGLVGVARFQPASLVATACFFGVAIGVSFVLQALMGGAA